MKNILERAKFLQNALKDHKVGALTMSSDYVVAAVLRLLPKAPRLVVEYGPGEGTITRKILRVLPSDARLIVVEPNLDFVEALKKVADPRLTIVPKMAQDLSPDDLFSMRGADAVVASLPSFYLTPEERQKVVADAHNMLAPKGVFIFSHQYSWLMKKPLEEKFADVAIAFEPRNIFPCFILSGRKP
ncbi:MAG: hypothetical protein A3C93_06115 [Candidatus Lloydbacteria bacterium RIFCSPHIGHO2_02_FULL_54_17]|uniref:Methyltransferase domain-containing protein n=1 Tax=Candidatus Lloydbacteria bacterium RIFCSPHIGHO2_02_FULL_54_17 TaxID=1798664 RepID=A0A1G2DG65_9BACT|nr:MAG: hypothetical protein A2762_02140 [Candidatus Lloydbacteria bacterium RIFCSPHIGHO2_01_FULL_54_11]OGZ12654.1 MAG: hypothetical protein A3C93_06115 [Candidatus Lloydbacteria bacterium RIFCSPHIGHO2_02_FULL_54_17]OGZ13506.1 MAG: hypothetical protein A2948_04780 [Candidatus Lloydbacteria bacterium RIFCSPLOWO2_01_FULL_54_18]OGZ16178.1 MAG: hypothetical protein A3H76_03615 [Candidatus Lloydbacteria bacterium RIFCSPLOWO2_02_FULL_54_12]